MAKDPRFNFYTDNWIGGTEGFTLEQEGAYLALIIMQTKIGPFSEAQAFDKLLQKTRGNTAVCTTLWKFLLPKFKTDGKIFWSERLAKEVAKSKKHSEKQTERINKRWNKDNGNTAVLPVNSTGSGNGIGDGEKGVQGETESNSPSFMDYEAWTLDASSGNDYLFTNMLKNNQLKPNGQLEDLARSHLALLAKYPKMKPPDQHRFRISLIDHIAKEIKHDSNINTRKSGSSGNSSKSFSGKYEESL